MGRHPRPPVNGRPGVRLVNAPHQLEVARGGRHWRVIEGRAMQPDQLTWPADTEGQSAHVDHRPFGLNRIGQLFFSIVVKLTREATNAVPRRQDTPLNHDERASTYSA
jgi:hypothetical protein